MRHVLQSISILALIATIMPAVIYLAGNLELTTVKFAMLGATILWFIVAPLAWQRERKTRSADENQR